MILHLHGNPCCDDDHYRLQLVLNLKNLRVRRCTYPLCGHVHTLGIVACLTLRAGD